MTAGITSSTFTKCKWRIRGHGDQLEIYDSVSWYTTAGISSTVIKCNSRTKSTTDIFGVYDSKIYSYHIQVKDKRVC